MARVLSTKNAVLDIILLIINQVLLSPRGEGSFVVQFVGFLSLDGLLVHYELHKLNLPCASLYQSDAVGKRDY
ncbi:hypothetical protein [Yersinia bercovieri]|uniref:hypothetical protein n=1 Tax=Yersinia bercovieri TaxID=634 RepID=UPI00119F2D24|nr:hypothetical protein [Yersinia bercovieri]